jgi:hypothetical protein
MVTVLLHFAEKRRAGDGLIAAGLEPGAASLASSYGEATVRGCGEPNRLEKEMIGISESNRAPGYRRRIKNIDRNSKSSDQLLFEGDVFAYATTVNHCAGTHIPCNDRPLRQDPYRFLVGQWLGVEGIEPPSEPMTDTLWEKPGNDFHPPPTRFSKSP